MIILANEVVVVMDGDRRGGGDVMAALCLKL